MQGAPSLPLLRGCPRTTLSFGARSGTTLRERRSERDDTAGGLRRGAGRRCEEGTLRAPSRVLAGWPRPSPRPLSCQRAVCTSSAPSFARAAAVSLLLSRLSACSPAPPVSLPVLSPAADLFLPGLSLWPAPREGSNWGRRQEIFSLRNGGTVWLRGDGDSDFFNVWGPPDCSSAYILGKILNAPNANILGRRE
jgi:hypothetical protein